MAKQLYGQQQNSSLSDLYTTSRSTIDTYRPETSRFTTSRYLPTFSGHFSLSSDRTPSAFADSFRSIAGPTTSSTLWPSFDVSSALTKRPFEALYNHSPLGAPVIGQSEAWLTSDSLAKRPRLESASNLPVYPQRPGEKDCAHYMLTRTCKFGDSCKFDHPLWVPEGGIPDWKELPSVPFESNPERPGEPDCPYFLKTQKCKFGFNCKFNHPKDKLGTPGKTDASDLPERPSEPLCSFYMKTGKCKFGAACKFHHPKDIQIPSDGQEASNKHQNDSAEDVGAICDGNAVKTLASNPASSYNSKGLPIRQGEVDCPFFMKTGSCKYGANCRYNHPDRNEIFPSFSSINPAAAVVGHSSLTSPIANLNVGLVNPAASILQTFQPRLAQTTFGPGAVLYPQRPGQIECDYYMKTGVCKFGERCRFHHPIDRSSKPTQEQNVKLTLAGLPRREGALHCPFYMKTGTCSYGPTCKFDHPPPGEVMALAEKETATTAEEEAKEDGETAKTTEG